MKVLITYPPLKSDKGFPLLSQNRQFQWFSNPSIIYPLIPASAATLLDRNGFEVIWKDAIAENCGIEEYLRFFETANPNLVAIETKTPVIKQHWNIINRLKELNEDAKFVLMGDHVTALPEESLRECSGLDYVLTGGDYDFSLLGMCKNLIEKMELPKGIWYRENGRVKNTGRFELANDLDDLPFIDRGLTKGYLYNKEYNIKKMPFAYTMAGRDCPYHSCRFCSWPTLFPKFRARSPGNLLDEIGILIEKYKVKEIFDDTGTFPRGAWLSKFCEGMVERGYNEKITFSCNMRVDYVNEENAKMMKNAGFRLLKVGLESANQGTLDKINKGIKVEQITDACRIAKNAGMETHLTMIVGYPWETREDAMKTFELARKLMTSGLADVLQSTVLVPYPGTALYEEGLKNGWFRFDPAEYERYDMTEPVFKTADMTPEEVMKICNKIYQIFLSPRYMAKRVASIRSVSDVKYVLRGVKAVVGHLKDFAR